jgi:2'-5' RNA ligase
MAGRAWIEEATGRLPEGLSAESESDSAAHLSYHVAEEYSSSLIEHRLPEVARSQAPITVRPSGLTVFTEPKPVVCASIVRSPALSGLHRAIWDAADGRSSGTVERFAPERWAPHVTLAQGELDRSDLPAVVEALSEVDFEQEFVVDNLTCTLGEGENEQVERFAFGR